MAHSWLCPMTWFARGAELGEYLSCLDVIMVGPKGAMVDWGLTMQQSCPCRLSWVGWEGELMNSLMLVAGMVVGPRETMIE